MAIGVATGGGRWESAASSSSSSRSVTVQSERLCGRTDGARPQPIGVGCGRGAPNGDTGDPTAGRSIRGAAT